MTKRDKAERLAAQAETAWDMAEQGCSLPVICLAFLVKPDRVWQLLKMHQRRRRSRR